MMSAFVCLSPSLDNVSYTTVERVKGTLLS